MNDTYKLQMYDIHVARLEAMRKEIIRLNNEVLGLMSATNKVTVSDPNFMKPLTEIEKRYE